MNHSMLVNGGILWRKVLVDESWFQGNPLLLIDSFQSDSVLQCSVACEHRLVCNSYCHNGQICSITYLIVSPLHVATNIGPVRTCYTSEPKDFIVGSIASQSDINAGQPNRHASNFAIGVLNFVKRETCAGGGYFSEPWQLFDLKEAKVIREVRVRSQFDPFPGDLPNNVEVRIGKAAPATPGDFSNYRLFGTLPSSTTPNTTYILKASRQYKAQFVSIKKPNTFQFVICGVQVL